MVRGRARLDTDQARRQHPEEASDIITTQLSAEHYSARGFYTVNLKDALGDVQTDGANLLYGRLSLMCLSAATLWHIAMPGGEAVHHIGSAAVNSESPITCFATPVMIFESAAVISESR